LDNPSTESSQSPLNTDQAASLFAEMLDPEREQPEQQAEGAEPAAPTEETPAEPQEAEQQDEPTYTVTIDGKEVEVPLSELKNGYQRQSDYTRKTMEAAELRKQAEAETMRAHQERQAYAANLQRMQVQLEGALQEQQQIDWQKLLESDPVEYLKQQHLFQQRQAAYQQNLAHQNQLMAIAKAELEQNFVQHLSSQRQTLLEKIPDWKDSEKAQAGRAELSKYLIDFGYDPEDVHGNGLPFGAPGAKHGLTDAKTVILARKAMLYDQMMSKASAAAKKVQNLPQKVERSGTGESHNLDRRGAAFQKLSKTGRIEDAAAVFASLI